MGPITKGRRNTEGQGGIKRTVLALTLTPWVPALYSGAIQAQN